MDYPSASYTLYGNKGVLIQPTGYRSPHLIDGLEPRQIQGGMYFGRAMLSIVLPEKSAAAIVAVLSMRYIVPESLRSSRSRSETKTICDCNKPYERNGSKVRVRVLVELLA